MTDRPPTDEELLARRDEEAFALFYRRHAAALLGYLARRTGNAELAADLTAETFAAALAGAHRFRPARGSAVNWLYGIARHLLYRALERGHVERRARDRFGMPAIALDDEALERIEALASLDVSAERLRAELDAMPADQRLAVEARVVEERHYGEIAGSMAISETAVRQRVSRGLARLRAALGGAE
jgi:RNA polymerase sigma-70 factor (ECF subfamily)